MVLSWSRALAWRMRRQLLDPVGTESVEAVVCRLGAVPAHPDAGAELAVRVRRERSRSGEVADALAEGRIVKTYAFRGATHLLTPEDGGACLALRAASRMWELPSWQRFYGLTPADWPLLREAVRAALAGGPMTREELGAAVTARPELRHLGIAFADGAETLLKPLAWQGDLSFGPPRDGRATFQRLDHNPRWAGLPDLDTAGVQADPFLDRGPWRPPRGPRHRRGARVRPARGPRGAGRDARDECRATAAGIRPMGAGSGHRRRPRRAAGQADAGQPRGKDRDCRWRRLRHLVAARRPRRRRLVRRGGAARAGTLAEELARLATILDRPLRPA